MWSTFELKYFLFANRSFFAYNSGCGRGNQQPNIHECELFFRCNNKNQNEICWLFNWTKIQWTSKLFGIQFIIFLGMHPENTVRFDLYKFVFLFKFFSFFYSSFDSGHFYDFAPVFLFRCCHSVPFICTRVTAICAELNIYYCF